MPHSQIMHAQQACPFEHQRMCLRCPLHTLVVPLRTLCRVVDLTRGRAGGSAANMHTCRQHLQTALVDSLAACGICCIPQCVREHFCLMCQPRVACVLDRGGRGQPSVGVCGYGSCCDSGLCLYHCVDFSESCPILWVVLVVYATLCVCHLACSTLSVLWKNIVCQVCGWAVSHEGKMRRCCLVFHRPGRNWLLKPCVLAGFLK
jgi:hypothetical protein